MQKSIPLEKVKVYKPEQGIIDGNVILVSGDEKIAVKITDFEYSAITGQSEFLLSSKNIPMEFNRAGIVGILGDENDKVKHVWFVNGAALKMCCIESGYSASRLENFSRSDIHGDWVIREGCVSNINICSKCNPKSNLFSYTVPGIGILKYSDTSIEFDDKSVIEYDPITSSVKTGKKSPDVSCSGAPSVKPVNKFGLMNFSEVSVYKIKKLTGKSLILVNSLGDTKQFSKFPELNFDLESEFILTITGPMPMKNGMFKLKEGEFQITSTTKVTTFDDKVNHIYDSARKGQKICCRSLTVGPTDLDPDSEFSPWIISKNGYAKHIDFCLCTALDKLAEYSNIKYVKTFENSLEIECDLASSPGARYRTKLSLAYIDEKLGFAATKPELIIDKSLITAGVLAELAKLEEFLKSENPQSLCMLNTARVLIEKC
jgi:hypothetical protein